MIKGIVALFTSGLIANPMILLGILSGGAFYAFMDEGRIFQLYKNPMFYGLALGLSLLYIVGFRRVYTTDGQTDWGETCLAVVGAFFKFFVASLLMISFISLFDMGDVVKVSDSDF